MAEEYPPRDRLSLRAYIRARLRGRGLLEFADDDEDVRSSADLVYVNCGRAWCEDAFSRTDLELEALLATTTDVPMQGIENTVQNNDEFWSSSGASVGAAGDALLYRLRQPLSRVAYVSIAVYRAFYQHGDPLYPPRRVSFLTGPSPNQLYPASPIYPVRLTDSVQVFALSPTAAVSQYLMVRLHGRLQRQWEDLQFYIAIRHVGAYGDPVNLSYSIQLSRLLRSSSLTWPCTRGLVSAVATSGTVEDCSKETIYSVRSGGGGGGGGASHGDAPTGSPLRTPPQLGRHAGVDSSQDQALAEDVYVVGPVSSAESRRAYVSVAPWRKAASQPLDSAPMVIEADVESEQAELAFPVRPARPRGHRAALPSGPTDSELRLAVQCTALTRALPHLVNVSWPELLITRQHDQAQQQQQPWQTHTRGETTPDGDAAAGTGNSKWGIPKTKGGSLKGWHCQWSAQEPAGPRTRFNLRGRGCQDTSAPSSHTRIEYTIGHEYGRPLPRRTKETADSSDRATGTNEGDAGAHEITELRAHIRRRVLGPCVGAALPLGAVSTAQMRNSDPRQQHHLDDGEEEDVGKTLGWLREDLPPRGSDAGSVSSAVTAAEVSPLDASSSRHNFQTAPNSGQSAATQDSTKASGQTTTNMAAYLRILARLHSPPALPIQRPSDSSSISTDTLDRKDLRHQVKQEGWQQQQQHTWSRAVQAAVVPDGAVSVTATPPAGITHQIRHSEDIDLGGARSTRKVAGHGGGNGSDEAQQRRRQRHLRAAQRAMQPAMYLPQKNTALFVVLDVWVGLESGSGSSAPQQTVASAAGNHGSGEGCWLVSHYDNEHI